jgi:hypothetical protein
LGALSSKLPNVLKAVARQHNTPLPGFSHVTDQIVLGLRKLFMSSRAAQAAPQTVPMQPSTNAIASKFFM